MDSSVTCSDDCVSALFADVVPMTLCVGTTVRTTVQQDNKTRREWHGSVVVLSYTSASETLFVAQSHESRT